MGKRTCSGLCIEDKTLFHLTTMLRLQQGELWEQKNTLNTSCHPWNVINLATACNSVGHDEVWVTSGNSDKTLSTKGYKFRKYIPTQQHTKIEPRTQHCFTMRLWQEKRFRFSSRWTHTYGNQELLKCNQSFCIYLLIGSSKNDQK